MTDPVAFWLLIGAVVAFAFAVGYGIGFCQGDDRRHRRIAQEPIDNPAFHLANGNVYISAHSDFHAARELIASLAASPPSIRAGR